MSIQYKPSYSLEFLKQASNKKFGIVSSEWNGEIIQRLLNGSYDFFSKININKDRIQHYNVPGSFELISGCVKMQSDHHLDAIIAIGSIVQGETKHFDFIAQSVCNGIKDLNIVGNCPIILCLLTDNDYQQALDRSGGKHGNKGYDCAEAAARMTLI